MVGILVVLVVGVAVVRPAVRQLLSTSGCTVRAPSGTFTVSTSQARYAATIAAVGGRDGMPDHAVSVALAAALQESKLANLPYGDRDSVGLFQQRPSQGWGPRASLLDPVYAADAFYRALVKVPGWQQAPVTVAAQEVQHSAAPSAYAAWDAEGRSLAEALTGEVPAALACGYPPPATRAAPAVTAAVSAVTAAAKVELGGPLPGVTVATKAGWRLASWLVARGQGFGIDEVSFAGRRWTVSSRRWTSTAVPAVSQVTFTVG